MTSLVDVAATLMYALLAHLVMGVHTRSEKPVAAVDSHSDAAHLRCAVHLRSLVADGAFVSNSMSVAQIRIVAQERSEVAVGTTV